MKGNNVDTGMELVVCTWFHYLSSDRCTEVNDITILDSWVISAQGHFTKNTDLFPRKISNSLVGCHMIAVVRQIHLQFTKTNGHFQYPSGNVVRNIKGLEYDLLLVVLQKLNKTYVRVPKPEYFEMGKINAPNLVRDMFTKETYIAFIVIMSCYVPCSVKYPRWNSILRILSVELWLVLFISIVLASTAITLVGRYSCKSEWQGYKTLTSSLINVWAVILGVTV